ncbi:cupin domain-containing protein [Methylocystis bryophila]|uniref:Cupin n=1 Tax=Methylocystis bryophila TaxID=655015 RepID=A0A1W6MSG2_9HYPH|nr:cupin domain-containing protein [Methylocystis bryophila]ARN80495.1 cupin [Methylocystis bryophila]BDV40520.1 hypothetical protein DSM21852_37730 [Methylocystis bryophila]
MKSRLLIATAAALTLAATGAPHAGDHAAEHDAAVDAKPDFAGLIPNIPGKSLKTVIVNYGPGGASAPHRHASSAFILAYVLEGEVRSSVNGEPPRIFRAGEHWTENPGDVHGVSENASKTKPAKLLAIFVLDSDDNDLTRPDVQREPP